jgi:hypothetical protein
MKEHILRECVNRLVTVAKECHGHESLRDRFLAIVLEAINADNDWWRAYESSKVPSPITIPGDKLSRTSGI